MRKELPFDLREFKEAHRIVANSQNEFARLVVETISEESIFRCSYPYEVPHPVGIGSCFKFLTNINVCGLNVKLHLLTDSTIVEGFLLSLSFTCNDMFIYNRRIDIPVPKEFTLMWNDVNTEPPHPPHEIIVKN